MIDLERVRGDTPGVEHVAHFSNAGSALPPRQVVDAVVEHLQREAEIGGYEAAAERQDRWEHTYGALARLIGAHRDENWETYYAGKVGLGVAVDYALAIGVENAWERIQVLASRLRASLGELPEVTLLDRGAVLSATVTFTVADIPAGRVQRHLATEGVNVSVLEAASAQLDFGGRGIDEAVRASVHYYNSDDEIDVLVDAVNRARTTRA